jgi:hypothetical protein
MTSPLTYHLTQARIDELLRDAAERRRMYESSPRPNDYVSKVPRGPRYRLSRLRRALSGPAPRPATR